MNCFYNSILIYVFNLVLSIQTSKNLNFEITITTKNLQFGKGEFVFKNGKGTREAI